MNAFTWVQKVKFNNLKEKKDRTISLNSFLKATKRLKQANWKSERKRERQRERKTERERPGLKILPHGT